MWDSEHIAMELDQEWFACMYVEFLDWQITNHSQHNDVLIHIAFSSFITILPGIRSVCTRNYASLVFECELVQRWQFSKPAHYHIK